MKLLFATAMAPLPTRAFGWNDSLTDGMSQRFTKGQDLFTLHGHQHHQAVHLLAQNLRFPSDILEHPRREDLERALRQGYDYFCISFMAMHTDIVREMCAMARRLAPKTKIVLGGHGIMAWRTLPREERERLADHVCPAEGVRFLRQLLGDEPVDRPIRQRLMPTCSYSLPWLDRYPGHGSGTIVSGLGCPAGCDYCPTTTMYGKKRLEMASPQEVWDETKRYYRDFPDLVEVVLIEEDHFRQRDHLMEIARLAANDSELGLDRVAYFTFGSISAMSEWSPEEMARTGVSTVFVGVESKFASEHGYDKRAGDAREVLAKLHRVGIASMAAWMGGFDFHTLENIDEDLEYFISCRPTYNQLSRVCPFPGTPMWQRLRKEGRLHPVPWERVHFYGGGGLEPANIDPRELDDMLLRGYSRLYEACGPTIMRYFEVQLNGWDFCRASSDPILHDMKAERHRSFCHDLYGLSRVCALFAPNRKVRDWIRGLADRYVDRFGKPTRAQELYAASAAAFAAMHLLLRRKRGPDDDPFHEPCKLYSYPAGHWLTEGRPYKTRYPRFDPAYYADRALYRLSTSTSGALIELLDRLFGEDTVGRMGPVGRLHWAALQSARSRRSRTNSSPGNGAHKPSRDRANGSTGGAHAQLGHREATDTHDLR